MTGVTTWQLLFVDDDVETCRQVREFLEGETIAAPDDRLRVETLTDFARALNALEAHRFDLLILDVRLGPHDEVRAEEVGITTLETIRQRCFVPVVFYTGLPHLVQNLETPLIRVVEKTEGLQRLLGTIIDVFATRLPAVNRALIRHLETVQRDYMWDFVAVHWERFGDTSDRTALAYLLARRLAMSLSGPGIRQLAQDLGDPLRADVAEGRVHPMRYYVLPPVEPSPLAGDLYLGQIGKQNGYWMLLTPSCDLVAKREKAEQVLFAHCLLLTGQEEYQTWKEKLPHSRSDVEGKLQALLKNNRQKAQAERFYFLPGALTLPDLVVDFQQLVILPRGQMDRLERLASLDSPFVEALLARFARYFGRLGTPDLDVDVVIERLKK
jgi:CheY-like chemotaxis protein